MGTKSQHQCFQAWLQITLPLLQGTPPPTLCQRLCRGCGELAACLKKAIGNSERAQEHAKPANEEPGSFILISFSNRQFLSPGSGCSPQATVIPGVNRGVCTSARGLLCTSRLWVVSYRRLLPGLNASPALEASPPSFLKALMYTSLCLGNGCVWYIPIALGKKEKNRSPTAP